MWLPMGLLHFAKDQMACVAPQKQCVNLLLVRGSNNRMEQMESCLHQQHSPYHQANREEPKVEREDLLPPARELNITCGHMSRS